MDVASRLIKGAVLIVGFALLSACGSDSSTVIEERIRPVRTAKAIAAPQAVKRRFAGSSQAASTSNISFRVSGIIAEFPAQVGISLNKGDLIARLDSNDYQIKLAQERAALERVMANAANTKSRFQRVEKLFADHTVSEMDYETAKAEYHAGIADVRQARRSVELSNDQLTYTRLLAPADGCSVTEANAAENENITAGQTVAILSCGAIMEIVASVLESVVGLVTIGQEVEAVFNTIKDKHFKAEVAEIGISSSANGVYTVTARLLDEHPGLRPGMAAELMLARRFDLSADHVWVPMAAVGEEDKKRFVMLYQPVDEKTGKVKRVEVDVGRYAAGLMEITRGLRKDQKVITAGLSQIQDGLTVKLLQQDL